MDRYSLDTFIAVVSLSLTSHPSLLPTGTTSLTQSRLLSRLVTPLHPYENPPEVFVTPVTPTALHTSQPLLLSPMDSMDPGAVHPGPPDTIPEPYKEIHVF